jgi:hypothetical protein
VSDDPKAWRIHITGPNGAELDMIERAGTPLQYLIVGIARMVEEVHEADSTPPSGNGERQDRKEPGPKR